MEDVLGGDSEQLTFKGMMVMSDRESKVVGYFSYFPGNEAVCTDGVACVISGSQEKMQQYLSEMAINKGEQATIKKTRFGEILKGLRLGAAYAFDEESYGRFYPLARSEGLDVSEPTVFQNKKENDRFLTVKLAG